MLHFTWIFNKSFRIIKLLCSSISTFLKNWYFASFTSLAYKYILSISGCWFITLNKEFVFPDLEIPIINILYVWSRICGQFWLYTFMFSFKIQSKLIIFCIVLLYCHTLLFHLLDLWLFHMLKFLSDQLIAFFYHQLNLKQSCY